MAKTHSLNRAIDAAIERLQAARSPIDTPVCEGRYDTLEEDLANADMIAAVIADCLSDLAETAVSEAPDSTQTFFGWGEERKRVTIYPAHIDRSQMREHVLETFQEMTWAARSYADQEAA